jgi:hypothetical protein
MKKGTVKLRGLRSPLPKGTIIARPAPGKGDAELVKAGTALALRRDRLDATISGDVTIDQTGQATVVGLQGVPVGTAAPVLNDVLTFDGTDWNPAAGGGGGGGINQLTGDATAGPGSGSQPITFTSVNSDVGTFGDATNSAQITVNAKGLITAVSNVPISGGGGGGGDFVLIESITPIANVASFTSPISGSYRHLKIVGIGRSDNVGVPRELVCMTFNGDTGANYAAQFVLAGGIGFAGSSNTSGDNFIAVGEVSAAGGIAGYPGSFIIDIPLYAGSTLKKTCFYKGQGWGDVTLADALFRDGLGLWDGSSAIDQIDLTLLFGGNWVNTEISLYGLM